MRVPGDPLWVVTSYFNPAGSSRRRDNFRVFRRHLDAPLLVVELARAGQHQLDRSDGDEVIALTGDDRIWQKERLINLGVSQLPAHVRYVAWVDCDIVLECADWPRLAVAHLERTGGLLQLFDRAIHVPKDAAGWSASRASLAGITPLLTEESIGAAARDGRAEAAFRKCLDPDSRRANGDVCSTGMAWAARRSTLERCGLYDRAIVGGGDVLIVAAALAQDSDALLGRVLNRHQYGHFLEWAGRARHAELFRSVDALRGAAYHLWHGDLRDRRYGRRHGITAAFDFDPIADLEAAENGTWRWAAPGSGLAGAVADYFVSRREE